MFFDVDKTSLLPIELNFDINFNQNHFSSKKHIFAFSTKQTWIERQLFLKNVKLLRIKLNIYRQKFISILLALDQKQWV